MKKCIHAIFADDVNLVAGSWSSERMLILLRDALRQPALELHLCKCKAQTDCTGRVAKGSVRIDDSPSIHVLFEGAPIEVLATNLQA